MYAVIKTGGKQFQVSEGDVIQVEKLEGQPGDTVEIDEVLMLRTDDEIKIGTPMVEGVAVSGTIVDQVKGKKIIVYKFKRRKDYRRKQGHRQRYTNLRIDSIKVG
jgi:large subunit ribosomal protein L21